MNGKTPAQVGDLPLDSIYDGSDFVNGKAPADAVYGSNFVNGKAPAQVGDLPLGSIYDGSDFVNGKAPADAVYGSDFVNGKAPAQVGDLPLGSIYDGSDFVNGKAPADSVYGSDFVNGKAPAFFDKWRDCMIGISSMMEVVIVSTVSLLTTWIFENCSWNDCLGTMAQ